MRIVNTTEKEMSIEDLVYANQHGIVVVYKSKSSTRMNVFIWCMLSKLDNNKYGFIRLGYPKESNPTYVTTTYANSIREAFKNRELHAFNSFEDFIKFSQTNK